MQKCHAIPLLVATALIVLPDELTLAQETDQPEPQPSSRVEKTMQPPAAWFIRPEVGSATMHGRDSLSAAWVGLRFGRKILDSGILRWDVGFSLSGADEGLFTLEGGVEVQPLPRFVVTPLVRLGLGLLAEPEFGGGVYAGQFGLAINPARVVSIRGVYQIAGHGGEPGPDGFLGAIEFRWGGSRPKSP